MNHSFCLQCVIIALFFLCKIVESPFSGTKRLHGGLEAFHGISSDARDKLTILDSNLLKVIVSGCLLTSQVLAAEARHS